MKPDKQTTKNLIELSLKVDELSIKLNHLSEDTVFKKCDMEKIKIELKSVSDDIDILMVNVCRKIKED
jgi:hypothetical protein